MSVIFAICRYIFVNIYFDKWHILCYIYSVNVIIFILKINN